MLDVGGVAGARPIVRRCREDKADGARINEELAAGYRICDVKSWSYGAQIPPICRPAD